MKINQKSYNNKEKISRWGVILTQIEATKINDGI